MAKKTTASRIFVEWLKEGLAQPGKTQTELGKKIGQPQSRVSEMTKGDRLPKVSELKPMAEYFGKQLPPQLVPSDTARIKVVGYVGAGAEAHYYDTADDPNDDAPMPPGGDLNTVAVVLRGTSLGSIFDKWLVFYDEVRTPPTPDMYRKLCVVGLADGRVLVKKLLPGTKKGLFHLESQTEGLIEDQTVEWCAVVRAMTPR